MKFAAFLMFVVFQLRPTVADDFQATNEQGVRVFSQVPETGIHPRVLLSPCDLPEWRRHVITTYRGQSFFRTRYHSDLLKRLANLDPHLSDEELLAACPYSGPGDNHHLLFATLDALFHDDKQQGRLVCQATAGFARVVLARRIDTERWGRVSQNIGGVQGLSGIPAGLGHLWYRGGADFALAYDFLYDWMTDEERSVCRKALSTATKDLVTWGMGFPRGRAVSNWYGYHGELGIMLLAIEGEEGFHADRWQMFRRMMQDFAEVHMYKSGGSNEDGYTGNTALREGEFALIAMARRGDNYFNSPQYRNYWRWAVLSLVPGEDTGDTVEYSSAALAPYESAPVLARWAVPGDRCINYYLWRYKGADYSRQNRWQYAPMTTLFCMNWEDSDKLPLAMSRLNLPVTAVFPLQGLFITRSDWSDDALYLNLLTRQDAWYDRHENADRGRFVFAALGRRWAIDRPWAQAPHSSDHSLVHIDGLAQAEAEVGRSKVPCARLLSSSSAADNDGAEATDRLVSYAVADLKNAYNWQWTHSWKQPGPDWQPEDRTFQELGWNEQRPGQPPALHGADDPNSPRYNFEGCHLWRRPFNTVRFCWRTALLVRAGQPYALIVDDVQKDGDEHLYEWIMPVPDDVVFHPLPGGRVLLTEQSEETESGRPKRGSRRLLIVPMGPDALSARLEEYSASVSRGRANRARRLVFSSRSRESRFRMVLLPFRTTLEANAGNSAAQWKQYPLGAVLPEFSKPSVTGFSVKWADDQHTWTFAVLPDGRSTAALTTSTQKWSGSEQN